MDYSQIINTEKYQICQKVSESIFTESFLSQEKENNDRPCLLKVFKNGSVSTRIEDIIRFNSEISIAARLENENLVQIFDYGEYRGNYYIASEFIEGKTLDTSLRSAGRLGVDESVSIIKKICNALDYIHGNGIIQRDLNPSSIIIPVLKNTSNMLNVKLNDYGTSHLKQYSYRRLEDRDSTAIYCYMSPEQSGVIKGHVDERSDIYSLGIIFYQMLAGEIPYKGDSVREIIQKHITSEPVDLQNKFPAVPSILTKIIFKMMEKKPERRYQSASSIIRDLDLFSQGFRVYALGEHDLAGRPLYKTTMIGRENELNTLTRMYRNSLKGNGGLCLISGVVGSGKTKLIEEFETFVVSSGGFFASRKCFQSGENIPYGPFREVISIYLKNLKKRPEWEKREVLLKIKHDIGIFSEIIYRFNPLMKELLGDSMELVELDPDREGQRFIMVINSLFRSIGEIEKAAVIHIDNIQWLDDASLQLLAEIVQDASRNNILVIGTYRQDELSPERGFLRFLNNAREGNYVHRELMLSLFDQRMMEDFTSAVFSQDGEDIRKIAAVLYKKTKGNPYYALETIKQMIEENAIFFQNNRWQFNFNAVDTISISSNIIELILKRISLLSITERLVITYASVMGKRINIDLLVVIAKERLQHDHDRENTPSSMLTENDVIQAVDRGLSLQIFEEDTHEQGFLNFTHNRIREVFYSHLTEGERKELHAYVAEKILLLHWEENERVYYDLAYHYIKAKDRNNIIQHVYLAGLFAKSNYANEEAINYFSIVLDQFVEDTALMEDRNLLEKWIKSKEELGGLYLTTGEIEKAIQLYSDILPHKTSPYEKAKINRQICLAYFKTGNWFKCEEYGRKGLALLGDKLPVSQCAVVFGIMKETVIHIFHNMVPFYYRTDKKRKNAELHKLKMYLYVATNWMYILSNILKFINTILRMMNLSESRIGKSKELGMSMAAYASMCMAMPMFKRAFRVHLSGLKMREELGDDWGVGQSLQWIGYGYSWKGDYEQSNEYFFRSRDIFTRIGDLWEIGMNLGGISYNYYYTSEYDKSLAYSREYKMICMKLSDYYGLSRSYQYMALCLVEQGLYDSAEEYLEESIAINTEYNIKFNNCVDYISMGYLHLEKQDYMRAIEFFEKAIMMDKANNFLKEFMVPLYPYLAEAHLKKYLSDNTCSIVNKKKDIVFLKKICREALFKSYLWKNHYGYALLVYAQFHAALNSGKKARTLFRKSIRVFSKMNRRYNHAKAMMYYGLYMMQTRHEKEAQEQLKSSYDLFNNIGAQGYCRRISPVLNIDDVRDHDDRVTKGHKLSTIIKLSQDIASTINLDSLIELVLQKSVEITGAHRGCFFVKNDRTDELELKASEGYDDACAIEYSNHIVEEVYQSGMPVITTDAERDEKYSVFQSVVLTGLKSILCMPVRCFDKIAGVCYIDNPIKSGAFIDEDIKVLEVLMAQAGAAMENAFYYRDLERKVKERTRDFNWANEQLGRAYSSVSEAYSIIKEDLSTAQKIQQSILTQKVPLENIDYSLYYRPFSEVGGDIYDVAELRKDYMRFFICDATGHGVQAALVTMIIKSEYDKIKHIVKTPSLLLESLNRVILEYYRKLHMVFTCAIVDIDLNNKKLLFSSAGHPTQYLIKNKSIISMEKIGRIIGLSPDSEYFDMEFSLGGGDKILMLTDGLYEQCNDQKEPYGEERLLNCIRSHAHKEMQGLIDGVFEDIAAFHGPSGTSHQDDDITIIGITIEDAVPLTEH